MDETTPQSSNSFAIPEKQPQSPVHFTSDGQQPQKPSNLLVILLVIVLFGLVGFGAYMFGQNSKSSIVTASPVAYASPGISPVAVASPVDETANWQIYQGSGFSLKYPPTWRVGQTAWLESDCARVNVLYKASSEPSLHQYVKTSAGFGTIDVKTFLREVPPQYLVRFKNISSTDVAILGPQGSGELNNMYIKSPNGYFQLVVLYAGPTPDTTGICKQRENEYKQVLSTFTLTSASNTKTYTNSQLGFSFEYPNENSLAVFEMPQGNDTTALRADHEFTVGYEGGDGVLLNIFMYKSTMTAQTWWNSQGVQKYNQLVTDFYNAINPKPATLKFPTFTILSSTIGGAPAVVAKGYVESAQRGDSIISVISHKGWIYMFEQLSATPTGEYLIKSNQILSTFSFN